MGLQQHQSDEVYEKRIHLFCILECYMLFLNFNLLIVSYL